MLTPEEMYATCITRDTSLEEFLEWASAISFEGYKEGFGDGAVDHEAFVE